MSQGKLPTHMSSRMPASWLLVSLLTAIVLILSSGLKPVSAWPKDPADPDPIDGGGSGTFTPYPNGFDWRVPSHFGGDNDHDGLIDYNWEPQNFNYKKSLIYPDSWPVFFSGCRTEADSGSGVSTTNTYKWDLNGETISGGRCVFTYAKDSPDAGNKGFTTLGTYHVTLTVTYGEGITSPTGKNPEVLEQDVVVKDILIISIGDSFASGEGNPDWPQQYETIYGVMHQTSPAKWEDDRCHRSAIAGPAQAALDIESSDPKTSVTFLSFACAGATVETDTFDPKQFSEGAPVYDMDPDVNKARGTGILGPYIGAQPPDGLPYSDKRAGYVGYIPSQMDQVRAALAPPTGKQQRPLDALVISGGGNDMMFANVVTACVTTVDCWTNAAIMESPSYGPLNVTQVINNALHGGWGRETDNIPHNYVDLANQVNALNPKPAHVYVTQYPDLTRDDNGGFCRMLDDVFWPNPLLAITAPEARTAALDALGGLNQAVKKLALDNASQGWQLVDGLASYDVDPNPATPPGTPGLFVKGHDGKGHGYCATDNWIRRADESELIQGPLYWRAGTSGTVHPNSQGHQAYKERLLYYMMPNLFPPSQSPNPPKINAPVYAQGGLIDVQGLNGWYTKACLNGTCSPKAVMRVVGTSDTLITGASVTINGMNACSVGGVSCSNGLSDDKKTYTWDLSVNADGIYHFQFTLQNSTGATANGGGEIKADFHDPVLTQPGPFTVDEGGSVVLSASASDAGGDAVNIDWDLNNDGTFETTDETPTFSAANLDGPTSQTIKVLVTDRAGRTTSGTAEINVANVAPAPTIDNVPVTNPEGTEINLSSTANDPGAADTFTYEWSVTKDGKPYDSGSESTISFTPDDNGAYEVTLKVTDDDLATGTATQTINVSNVVPTPAIKNVPSSSPEGTAISLNGAVTDPGSLDTTFTYAWKATLNGSLVASGTAQNFSFTPAENGSYKVDFAATDKDGGVGSTSQTITVTNVAPALSSMAYSPATINETGSVTVSGRITDPGTLDTQTVEINWGDGSGAVSQSLAAGTTSFTASHTYADDNPTGTASDINTITVKVTDKDSGSGSDSGSVTVNNLPPTVTITGPAVGSLYKVNTAVSITAALTDTSPKDTFTCSVSWDDGSTSAGTVAAGACSASHTYTGAGVYSIQVTGTDDDTGSDTKPLMVVVYDPSAGFVTGGGWIDSPAGAYTADPAITGKATFGFVSKYQKGATVPSGNTQFRFHAASFDFDSDSYQWMVVSGAKTQFKGMGSVNGVSGYTFLLTATDGQVTGGGGVDKFRIKVWNAAGTVYDNALGASDDMDAANPQAIAGGSIMISSGR